VQVRSRTDLKTIRIRYEQGRNERLARLIFDKFGVNEGAGVKHAKLSDSQFGLLNP
jgi:hypothetical protein